METEDATEKVPLISQEHEAPVDIDEDLNEQEKCNDGTGSENTLE